MDNVIQEIAVYAIPVLFAITVHEAAHGYVARMFGDNTAYVLGRVTLNPVKHIDPLGTIVIPLAMVLMTGFMFGWAKPVPVDWGSLRRPKRDMIWVAAAGPAANLLMAIVWALIYRVLAAANVQEPFFWLVARAGISVNLIFMALNLLPIPPLDGGRVVSGLLPTRASIAYSRIEPYGLIILLVLMFTGALSFLLRPLHDLGAAVVSLFL
ncbi:MAG: site-2 protease family protein [Burkholderiaceae bacterium]|jgi:Zn-dependent protease|nr:site-2 protease family protein [Burkholderiaceae bacterium]MDH5208258.1 site-2 protease family protein [Burkholderiaceae bacterium]